MIEARAAAMLTLATGWLYGSRFLSAAPTLREECTRGRRGVLPSLADCLLSGSSAPSLTHRGGLRAWHGRPTLKSMRFEPQGVPKITEWKKRIGSIPLVAIGGIKFEQAADIFAAGADSIAVVSDVTQHADPDARVRAWLGESAEAA